jgi:hypothetical protein
MKVYLAGAETIYSAYKDIEFQPDYNLFMSYFYKRACCVALPEVREKGHKGLITIDSGAHTFFGYAGMSVVHNDNNKKGEMPDPYNFFDEYLRWLKEYKKYYSYFVELDIQALLGQEVIDEWRVRIQEAGLADKCIMVHHSVNEDSHLEHIMDITKSGYIGFEGKMGGKFRLPYMKLLKKAYDSKIKVHGFALTSQKFISKYPFYSVDSSSWTACTRYGVLYKFDKGKMNQIPCNQKNFLKHNIPLELRSTNRGYDINIRKLEYNAKAFYDMQLYQTALWEKRGIHWKDS